MEISALPKRPPLYKTQTSCDKDDPHFFSSSIDMFTSSYAGFETYGIVHMNRVFEKKQPSYNTENVFNTAKIGIYVQPTKLPYQRSGWDERDYINTFDKFKIHQKGEHDPKIWDAAKHIMREHYAYQPRIVYGFDEIIKPIDKSPGWPGILYSKTIAEFRKQAPNRMDFMWKAMAEDVVFSPCYAFLKDEVNTKEKIDKHDKRLILCWDDAYQMVKLRFQEHDHEIMKDNWRMAESKMGWTPFYGSLHESLSPLDWYKYKVQEDFKRFDGTISAKLMYDIYEMDWDNLRADFKTPENKVRYWNIVHNSIHSFEILPNGLVVRHDHGNKSGTADTTPLNAKANTFLKAYEIIYFLLERGEILHEDLEELDIGFMTNYYSMITYGDDRLVGENIKITEQEKEDLYSSLGMMMPKEKIVISEKLAGLQFCGATIKKEQNRYYPCWGDSDKVYSSFFWNDTPTEETLLNYQVLTYGGKYHPFFNELCDEMQIHRFSERELKTLFLGV